MQTGFLTVDGKTYYLQENGKMLTKAKTFTPPTQAVHFTKPFDSIGSAAVNIGVTTAIRQST